jgi:peptidyl-prolyl cis-trans isomerase C
MLPIYARCTIAVLFSVTAVAGAQTMPPGTAAAPVQPAAAQPGSAAAAPFAPAAAPQTVLLRNEYTTLTRGEYDLELTKLPPDARGGFGADATRVNSLLNRMLIGKTIAAQARTAGVDKTPEAQQRIAAETDRILAALYTEQLDAQVAKEFDARPGLETAARERWLIEPEKYRSPEQINITQIVFDVNKRSKEDALKLAQETRARILAGADMNALARELSDDLAAKRTNGRVDGLTRDQLDPALAASAFALKAPGDLSEPVLSRTGYHIIRLEAKRPAMAIPFNDVKQVIIDDLRRQYVEQKRSERFASIRNDPKIYVNEPAVDALVIRVDPEVFKKAMEAAQAAREAGLATPPAKK